MSTASLVVSPGAQISWRRTPWDERAFGVPTAELLELAADDLPAARRAVNALNSELDAAGVTLATTRIGADQLHLKEALGAADWRLVETSMLVRLDGLQRRKPLEVFRRSVSLEAPRDDDIPALRELASTAFHYSRFHEDLRVPRARCALRYANWIDDLRAQGRRFFVHRASGVPAAFMAVSRSGPDAELVLGGARADLGWLSPFFWGSVLEALRLDGAQSVQARVSAANVGVLKLYLAFGFTVRQTDFGMNRITRTLEDLA